MRREDEYSASGRELDALDHIDHYVPDYDVDDYPTDETNFALDAAAELDSLDTIVLEESDNISDVAILPDDEDPNQTYGEDFIPVTNPFIPMTNLNQHDTPTYDEMPAINIAGSVQQKFDNIPPVAAIPPSVATPPARNIPITPLANESVIEQLRKELCKAVELYVERQRTLEDRPFHVSDFDDDLDACMYAYREHENAKQQAYDDFACVCIKCKDHGLNVPDELAEVCQKLDQPYRIDTPVGYQQITPTIHKNAVRDFLKQFLQKTKSQGLDYFQL